MNTLEALTSLCHTDHRWHLANEIEAGHVFVHEPQPDEASHIVPVITTLWDRPWSVPFLAVRRTPALRLILVPRSRPLNKLAVFAAFAEELVRWESAVFADADVLLGQRDYLAMVQSVPSILTGGPEVAGTFHAFCEDVASISSDAPPFDGWGHEDIYLMYKLLTEGKAVPDLPKFISVSDSLAIAHAHTLRAEASDGSGPGIAARRNFELLHARVPDDVTSRVLFMHAARKWRDTTQHSTEFSHG